MAKNRILTMLITVILTLAPAACTLPATIQQPTMEPSPTHAIPIPAMTLGPAGPANQLGAQVEAVYALTTPAAVNITVRVIAFDFFMQPIPQEGTGWSFIYDTDGHIATNSHVVQDGESISVALATRETYATTVIGEDPFSDLAVLQTEAGGSPAPIALADSDRLRVAQSVVALGNPFGLERTLTTGVISSLSQHPWGREAGERW